MRSSVLLIVCFALFNIAFSLTTSKATNLETDQVVLQMTEEEKAEQDFQKMVADENSKFPAKPVDDPQLIANSIYEASPESAFNFNDAQGQDMLIVDQDINQNPNTLDLEAHDAVEISQVPEEAQ